MLKRTYGKAGEGLLFSTATSGTTPIVSRAVSMENFDTASFQLITDAAGTGAWKVEASNDWQPANAGGPSYGQAPGKTTAALAASAAHWSDVTAAFVPAIAAVTTTSSQGTQAAFDWRALRVTYTPATGTATAICLLNAKSMS